MILRLVREQLRSMWKYTAWSAGLLTFAVALGTYAMVTGATALGFPFNSDSFSQKANAAAFGSVFAMPRRKPNCEPVVEAMRDVSGCCESGAGVERDQSGERGAGVV